MDDLILREDGTVEYRWTFTGTSSKTGKSVRIPGFEEWTIAPDGLIAESRGHYDQAEYDRQTSRRSCTEMPIGLLSASWGRRERSPPKLPSGAARADTKVDL
jgi:hypothetical protein